MGLTQTDELLNEGLEVRGRSSQRHSTGLEKANCHVMERVTWQKSVLVSRGCSPQSYNCKELNLAHDMNELGYKFFPRASTGKCSPPQFQPCKTLSRATVTMCLNFRPTEL